MAQMLKPATMAAPPVAARAGAATAGEGMPIKEIMKTETSAIRIAVTFW